MRAGRSRGKYRTALLTIGAVVSLAVALVLQAITDAAWLVPVIVALLIAAFIGRMAVVMGTGRRWHGLWQLLARPSSHSSWRRVEAGRR